jgi:hypothetical protein
MGECLHLNSFPFNFHMQTNACAQIWPFSYTKGGWISLLLINIFRCVTKPTTIENKMKVIIWKTCTSPILFLLPYDSKWRCKGKEKNSKKIVERRDRTWSTIFGDSNNEKLVYEICVDLPQFLEDTMQPCILVAYQWLCD